MTLKLSSSQQYQKESKDYTNDFMRKIWREEIKIKDGHSKDEPNLVKSITTALCVQNLERRGRVSPSSLQEGQLKEYTSESTTHYVENKEEKNTEHEKREEKCTVAHLRGCPKICLLLVCKQNGEQRGCLWRTKPLPSLLLLCTSFIQPCYARHIVLVGDDRRRLLC